MSEVRTNLGEGLLAIDYAGGLGIITVAPASAPRGGFPTSGIFSVEAIPAGQTAGALYTVSAVAASSGNQNLTLSALEFGTDAPLAPGARIVEVETVRSLTALIAQGAGGGSVSYKYHYFAGGVAISTSGAQAGLTNGLIPDELLATPPTGGVLSGGPGVGTWPQGSVVMLPVFVPSSWDGSAITVGIDLTNAPSVAAGTIDLTAFATDIAPGADTNSALTWSAAGATVSQTVGPSTAPTFPLSHYDLLFPVSGISPGRLVYIAIVRSALDTFAGNAFVILTTVGIKY